jgi:serine/threonine protein kinase
VNTTDSSKCPQCGEALPPKAPGALCPQCLMAMNMATPTESFAEALAAGVNPADRFTPPTPAQLAPMFPQFEIIELIGRGGMGAVYKARQTKLDRLVALKILPPHIGNDPDFAERFTREAKALAKLNHPGIVTLYEFGQAQGSVLVEGSAGDPQPTLFYFLMEFIDGVNLRQLIGGGRLSPREALAIVPQICDALQYAHDKGIIHRDIKPENILVDRQGRVKLADFGVAKLIGPEIDRPGNAASDAGLPAENRSKAGNSLAVTTTERSESTLSGATAFTRLLSIRENTCGGVSATSS